MKQRDEDADAEFEAPTPTLADWKTPSDLAVQIMETQGVAVTDDKDGFAFSLDWNFEEVQQRLQKLFPALFLWFNHDVESSFASKHQFSLFCQPWVICFKERMRLQVVNHITHPTGKDLDRNSRGMRVSWKQCVLYLGMSHYFLRDEKYLTTFDVQQLGEKYHLHFSLHGREVTTLWSSPYR